jgi:hypothetical protein
MKCLEKWANMIHLHPYVDVYRRRRTKGSVPTDQAFT